MFGIRESFGAKVLAGLLGTVGLLLSVAYLVVHTETDRQVAVVSQRALEGAERQFRGLEEMRQREVDRVSRILTESRRTVAALEEAIAAGDRDYVAGQVAYQLDLAGLQQMFVAFTDTRGRPVLTLHGAEVMADANVLSIADEAVRLLDEGGFEVRGYRMVGDTLFGVRTRLIDLAGRPIGTITFGFPITHADIEGIGELVGGEVCVVVTASCVAGTERGRTGLEEILVQATGSETAATVASGGTEWSVSAQLLVPGEPRWGWRVVAVPLDEVLAPFARIRRALLFAGGASILLALLVGTALSRGLTRPMRQLVAATGRVAEGDFETSVEVRSRDEVGTLAEAFNEMTRGLRLKERYRSVLDKVVSRDVAEELLEGGVELGGENRSVAVLFADIRGFTPLTEGMEPQEVIGLLNECMQLLSDAVEAEGGVVDKYVGDELMAIFGAPVRQEDHVRRAVGAALRMQGAVRRWNRERRARGQRPIGLGVGINAGVAVAGNMGSRNRLNYTVLGDVVNLGSRLCGSAEAGQILATARLVESAGDDVEAQALGGRSLKGIASEVDVVQVTGIQGLESDDTAEVKPGAGMLAIVLLGASLCMASGVAAQQGELPTLEGAGLRWSSASGGYQAALSGQLDLEGFWFSNNRSGLVLTEGGSTLAAHRLRIFTDLFVGEHVYAHVELRSDRGEAPTDGGVEARVEQAFVRASDASGAVSLQLGRFASPFGSYAARHLSPVDAFLRPPLPYDYRTVQCPTIAPPTASRFLSWRDEPEVFRYPVNGAPPIWGVPYQWGAMIAGAVGRVSYRVAAMNSAPSSAPRAWAWDSERLRHPSWVVGLGVVLAPELTLDASWSRGPWLEEIVGGDVSLAPDRFDYHQEVAALSLSYARGPVMVRAEGIYDRWEVPNLDDDPKDYGYSLEAQMDVAPGIFVAGRLSGLVFSFVDDGLGTLSSRSRGGVEWDYDAGRMEASVGYRVARNAGLLASWYTQRQAVMDDSDTNLFGVRLWWAF